MNKNVVKKPMPVRTFRIHAGTYDFSINFIITENIDKAVSFVNFKLGLPSERTLIITKEDFDCLGKRFYRYGYCPIIWLPKKPETPSELGTAYHEIFHVVCDIMRWAVIHLTNDSEEAYCHLIKHLTKSFFEKV